MSANPIPSASTPYTGTRIPISLDAIYIANPCPVSWVAMRGTDGIRFCGECRQNVYDLGKLSTDEATRLVNAGDPACVRFYRREDGRVMTADCPIGSGEAARRFARRTCAFVGMVAGAAIGLFIAPAVHGEDRWSARARQVEPFATLLEWFDPQPTKFITVGGVPCFRPPAPEAGNGGENAPPEEES